MKILLVSPFTNVSGSAIRFINIAEQLVRKGHTVTYIERKSRFGKSSIPPGIIYYTSPSYGNLFFDIIVATVFNLFHLLSNLDCDIYYALKPAPNNCIPALVAKLFGKRIFLDIDDLDYGYFNNGPKRILSKFFFDFFPRFFEIITCHTPNLKSYITDTLQIPGQKIYFLAQGVSSVFFQNRDPVQVREKAIIYMASLGITSDFPDLMPLFSSLCSASKDITITIIGDGVKRKEFESLVHGAGLTNMISFPGYVNHSELPAVIASHRIGIAYMRSSFTNNCRAVLKIREYLACGLQVVCNDTGDASYFDEYINIVPDIEAMGGRINELLSSPFTVNDAGQLFVEKNLRWEEIISEFLDFILIRSNR